MNPFKETAYTISLIAVMFLAFGQSATGDEYNVGYGDEDWWTAYPDQSSAAGGDVNHPSWALDALKSMPVLIYVHKSCDYCKPQTDAILNITEEFKGEIKFYEIGAEGNDARSEEALGAYDPNGGTMYVPLTVLLTLAPNSDGEVTVVWHSTDLVTGDAWIKNYVEDAISKYDENSADWIS